MDLRELYQDIIVDHNRSPRNFRVPEHFDRMADGFNPLCGDKLHVYLSVDDNRVTDVSFQGSGCAISVASASLMTEAVKGLTEQEARALFEDVHKALTGDEDAVDLERLGKLAAISGVRAFPSRVKCASLCWHTLTAALDQQHTAVSTE
jgi:nitrogen fixation protein NifU and related proteins